jgi:hypothetical protein
MAGFLEVSLELRKLAYEVANNPFSVYERIQLFESLFSGPCRFPCPDTQATEISAL